MSSLKMKAKAHHDRVDKWKKDLSLCHWVTFYPPPISVRKYLATNVAIASHLLLVAVIMSVYIGHFSAERFPLVYLSL